MDRPDIFVSHCSKDAEIADALIKMLLKALIPKIYPVLAAGATPKNLPPVIDDLTALNCELKKDLEALVRKLGDDHNIQSNKPADYRKQCDAVIRSSRELGERRKEPQIYEVPLASSLNKDFLSVFRDKPQEQLERGKIHFRIDSSGKFFDMTDLEPSATRHPLRLETPIACVRSVYVLLAAGNGVAQYRNQIFGRIGLKFTHDTQWTELVLGINIREWTRSNVNDRVVDASGEGDFSPMVGRVRL